MQLKYNEATKKSDGIDCNEINDQQIILSQPNLPHKGPVKSFKFYLIKLTTIDALFQQPNPNFKNTRNTWYKKSPCGINTIGSYMANISHAAGLSYIYTSHYSRGTTATCMKKAGYSLEEITWVLKHKNLESLKRYLAKPSTEDKENFSNDVFKAIGDVSSDDDAHDCSIMLL